MFTSCRRNCRLRVALSLTVGACQVLGLTPILSTASRETAPRQSSDLVIPLSKNRSGRAAGVVAYAPVKGGDITPTTSAPATAPLIYAVNSGNQLITFRANAPNAILSTKVFTGHQFAEDIIALDFRPLTGELYALGLRDNGPGSDTLRIYKVNKDTAAALLITTFTSVADAAFYGFDFDPQVDQIRVVNNLDQSFRFDPVSGNLLGVDANLNDLSGPEAVVGIASDRVDFDSNTLSTLFGIDTSVNRLVRIGSVNGTPLSPSGGVLTAIGPLGVNVGSNDVGFDIGGGVAYASMQNLLSGAFNLYTVNLNSGDATVVGAIGNGTTIIRGIAVAPIPNLVVTNTNDSGLGSLRGALNLAANITGPNTITFNIPGAGPHAIRPNGALPQAVEPITIDATTQPGYAGSPLIELDGQNTAQFRALWLVGGSSIVRGLSIHGFSEGIVLSGDNNTVTGCYIGTGPSGNTDLGNKGKGIGIELGSTGNQIGGPTAVPGTGLGNIISGNDGDGIRIEGTPPNPSGNPIAPNRIEGNIIGSDKTGTIDLGNGQNGIRITLGSTITQIGGSTPIPGTGAGNIISGNNENGILIQNSPGDSNILLSNRIEGNIIGADKTGTAAIGNSLDGIRIEGPTLFNHVGDSSDIPGTGAGNLISGNNGNGIGIYGAQTRSNSIFGNLIGTNLAGTSALKNSGDGILVTDGSTSNRIGDSDTSPGTGAGNVISGNGSDGIEFRDSTTAAQSIGGNLIGTNRSGSAAIGNGETGIRIDSARLVSVGTTNARNVISGNPTGILISAPPTPFNVLPTAQSNAITLNYIGTDKTGSFAIPNGFGIRLVDAGSNFIGSIGFDLDTGNLISGNGTGVALQGKTTRTTITTNLIGTEKTGTAKLGNGIGILVESNVFETQIGGFPGQGNVISGNTGTGGRGALSIDGVVTRVHSNLIGTDRTGTLPLGNGAAGIEIRGVANFIGGGFPTVGNLIAFNGGPGIVIGGLTGGNSIRLNSIHTNNGLGIDLLPLGSTPNDTGDMDVGSNELQNYPALNTVSANGSGTTFQGVLNSQANLDYHLDFYADAQGQSLEGCEGRTFVGSLLVKTDANGNAPFVAPFSTVLASGTPVTATATLITSPADEGQTSEFAPCLTVNSTGPTPTPTPLPGSSSFQFSTSSLKANEDAGFMQVTVTRAGDTSAAATVDYASTDQTATDRKDYTTAIGRLRFAAGETAKTVLVFVTDDVFTEAEESFQLSLSNPTGGASLAGGATLTLTIADNDLAPSVENPVDQTAFFVRQHYIDFLNRAPDPNGFAFWVNNIESCGTDMSCRDLNRADVSAAFFLSIEFQETGFLVHRIYRASLNRFPTYREFIRDSREIGRGVVVGRTGWEAQLELNQTLFATEFVALPEFVAIYGGMTNEQYVDALTTNSGVALSQNERDVLVAGLNATTETRATVLRKVSDGATFIEKERNRAFVLAEYFGYLRRNPDDSPDVNLDGFNFWLEKLNQFGGNHRSSEMVRAFLQSTEYRNRFGQP